MKLYKLFLIIAVIFASQVQLLFPKAQALSCVSQPEGVQAKFDKAGSVFTGTAENVREDSAIFKVTKLWKGVNAEKITARLSAFSFEPTKIPENGVEYLVFASTEGDSIYLSPCDYFGKTSNLSSDVVELDKITSPSVEATDLLEESNTTMQEDRKNSKYLFLILPLAFIVITGGTLLSIYRIRNKK